MKIRCIYQRGMVLPDALLAIGNTPESIFPIKHGEIYVVYGMALWYRSVPGFVPPTSVLHYLVLNKEVFQPVWYPAPLFEIADTRLPLDWHFEFWGNRPNYLVHAIWGYRELVTDGGKHYNGLIEGESEARSLFYKKKDEIDAELME